MVRVCCQGEQTRSLLRLIFLIQENAPLLASEDYPDEGYPASLPVYDEIHRTLLALIKSISSQNIAYRNSLREHVEEFNRTMGDNGQPHPASALLDFLYDNENNN